MSMKYIAESVLKQEVAARKRGNNISVSRQFLYTLVFGASSIFLYVMLYRFSGDIRHIAEITNQGDKHLFYVPLVIAFIFSIVHGAFTGHFWDALGLKPKPSTSK